MNLRILVVFILTIFCSVTTSANEPRTETNNRALDVVLVMDSSGSMKYSDPHDLRKPAAKLFIALLAAQAGTQDRASIISFSDEGYPVAYLTKIKGKANQEKLMSSIDKISTRGVYTNLYGALETALKVLNKNPVSGRKKVIVLMSDGKMDVGNNAKADRYTEKLLLELLPQLKANNIEVQTLAFTDASDQKLLKKIASQTHGKFKLALSDKDLHGVFTDIFEDNKLPDMIPFKGEMFKIDSSIKEVTIVGSKDNENVTLSLISPSKKIYRAQDIVKGRAGNIKWSESKLFDLITIEKPETGEWKIKASSGKNKAYVITDLSFKASTEPREPTIGEGVLITSWLKNGDTIIKQQDLRAPLSIKLHVRTPEGENHVLDMEPEIVDPGKADSGIFSSYIALPTSGRHELKMVTTTATFSREKIVYINVLNPVVQTQKNDPIIPPIPATTASSTAVGEKPTHGSTPDAKTNSKPDVKVDPHTDTHADDHSNGHADNHANNQENNQEHHSDQAKSPSSEHGQPAVTSASKPKDVANVKHNTDKNAPLANKKPANDSVKKASKQDKHKKDKSHKDNASHDDKPKKESGSATAVYVFVGINLLLLIIGGVIFFVMRKKGKKNAEADPELEDDVAEDLKEAA